ncbi:MAG: class I SAM-dependent methyltransferase [Patescibacteria group bacterium]
MAEPEKKEASMESDSSHYQRALDMEALGLMGITPDEKYRREVDVAFNEGGLSALPQGAKVLDLACGRGHTSKLVRDRGLDVTAVDFSPTAIEAAKKDFGQEGIDFRVGDMKNPPKVEGGYDAVTCFGRSLAYFERYEEYVEALKNWHEALKDGGKIAIEWTEWVDGAGGDNWQSIGGVEVQKEPFSVVDKNTGEALSYGETSGGNLEYPGAQLPDPIGIRRGGRSFVDAKGQNHDFGGAGAMFVDLLKQQNFPLIKRMIEEAGFANVRMVESPQPLTPPGQPKCVKVFAVTAEKASEDRAIGGIGSWFSGKVRSLLRFK